jgi:cyclophilin family peptidyl-prolyl cis-trans isomerase
VIQGGDPLTKSPAASQAFGIGSPGYQVPREFNSLKHDAMVVSAARTADPDSAGSQFYITLEQAPHLDQEQAADGVGYTVYGKVVKGQDVVLKLRANDVLKKAVVVK